ncbi:MAG: hypothetical protein ACRER0_03550 [Gammaproteobacteria bacterium]
MKYSLVVALLVMSCVIGTTVKAGDASLSPELQKLDVSVGRWVFHGETLNTPFGRAGKWTWKENCRWSENRVFMVCSFTNDWSGTAIKTLVVDTYNQRDHSFWHYELFNDGKAGAEPFVSKMTINGNTRVEYAESMHSGEKYKTRITYVFDSTSHVKVKIEISRHGAYWVKVDEGEGIKQP